MLDINYRKFAYLLIFGPFFFFQSFIFAFSSEENKNQLPIHPFSQVKFTLKDNILKTVISKGKGSSLEEARFHAAQNALLIILGTYVNLDNLIKKQVTINNNRTDMSSKLDKKVNYYSKGSIYSFDIIKEKKSGSLFEVTANVVINLGKVLNDSDKINSQNALNNVQIFEKVLAVGVDKTEDLALKNAVENALFQVAGSYIDRTQLIRNETKISEGIIDLTKNISTNIREFSKGSIQRIEVVNTKKNKNLFEVSALVFVEKKEFKPFIKRIGTDSETFESGLFSSIIKSQDKTLSDSKKLLELLDPLSDGSAYEITIREAQKLSKYLFSRECKAVRETYNNYDQPSIDRFNLYLIQEKYYKVNSECFEKRYQGRFNKNGTIIVPFQVSLKEKYKESLLRTLSNLEDKDIKNKKLSEIYFNKYDDFQLTFFDLDNETKNIYRFRDLKLHLRKSFKDYCHPFLNISRWTEICNLQERIESDKLFLQIRFLDSKGKELKIMKLPVNQYSKFVDIIEDTCNGYITVQQKRRICNSNFGYSRKYLRPGNLSLTDLYLQTGNNMNYYDSKGRGISSYKNFLLIFDDKTIPLSKLSSISIKYIK